MKKAHLSTEFGSKFARAFVTGTRNYSALYRKLTAYGWLLCLLSILPWLSLYLTRLQRYRGATVTITKNEILTALNRPEQYIFAIVEIDRGRAKVPCYIRRPFRREPDFGANSVNYALKDLLARGNRPC